MKWADERRQLQIRTNADTPHDAKQAVAFGAEGLGLVRTEQLCLEGERIKAVWPSLIRRSPRCRRQR